MILEVSNHSTLTTQSEHSIGLDEIESSCDGFGINARDCDDCSFSTATLHVFHDNDHDSKWIENTPPLSNKSQTSAPPRASLQQSRRMAAMLYESLSELLHSHRDLGPLAIGAGYARDNILGGSGESLEVRKEKLSSLLSEGLRDLDELENRSGACFPVMGIGGPLSFSKQAVLLKQKDQLVSKLSTVLTQIEELEAEEALSRTSGSEKKSLDSGANSSARTGNKRRTSVHSDISSITSWTTSSVPKVEPVKAKSENLFRLPSSLRSDEGDSKHSSSDAKPKSMSSKSRSSKPKSKGKSSKSKGKKKNASLKPSTQLECDIDSTLQDSFASLCSVGAEDKSPKRPQRRVSLGGHMASVLLIEPDIVVCQAAETRESTNPESADVSPRRMSRQPPQVTRSCEDGGATNPRLLRPDGRKKTDTRARIPQRKRSFEDPSSSE
jgi:hypothetical protein